MEGCLLPITQPSREKPIQTTDETGDSDDEANDETTAGGTDQATTTDADDADTTAQAESESIDDSDTSEYAGDSSDGSLTLRATLGTLGVGITGVGGWYLTQSSPIRWILDTGSDVESSPVLVDGTVYVGSYDNNVYALSAADGTEQ